LRRRTNLGLLSAVVLAAALSAFAQTAPVKIGQLDLTVGGLSATVTPAQPVIPKNVASGVQIVVTLNGQTLTPAAVAQYLGGSFQVQGEYSGPGLSQTVDVPQSTPAVNSLVLDLPAVNEAGNYTLSNLRFMVNGNDVFDLSPNSVIVDVIDQVLVTSVQTQALTLAQIQAMGVVLDSTDYTGFQFTVGLQISSQVVNISLPVVFGPTGVPVPTTVPPVAVTSGLATNVPVTIVPVLLRIPPPPGGGPGATLPSGIQIPSVLVIPGNVGYLKQFFSAQLYVANDTPGEANLVVDNISGTINLPAGPSGVVGGSDEPLALPTLTSGPEATTMPILLNGTSTLNAGQTGQAEWTIVANSEGFYNINFGINATLEGLPTGPVNLTGTAMGGLLVRNPYFNMTFTVPGVVRSGELFNVYATITNTSQAIANNLSVAIDAASLSGAVLTSGPMPPIPTLNPGDSATLQYQFKSLTTGAVVADYLNFNTQDGTTGTLNFTLGVFANGTPMSPDTIVLPSSVDNLPSDVVNAAMRVLGQAWSVATAPPGTLPVTVIPTTTAVVTRKAQALAEAGLRQTLGEPVLNAVRDLAPDFWGGSPVDPGFNQVLQTTPAGQNFSAVLGADLAQSMIQAGGPLPYELQLSQLEASGPDFLAFAVGSGTSAAPVAVSLTDCSGNQLSTTTPGGSIPGGVMLSLNSNSSTPVLGLVTTPALSPYTLLLTPQSSGTVDLSIAIPNGAGAVIRAEATGVTVTPGQAMRVVADFTNPNNLVLQVDTNGDGSFATSIPLSTQILSASGPNLISATVIGPETVSQAGPFGLNVVMLFDRIVDPTTSAVTTNYTIPNNSVQAASRELSGRLVFGNFAQPEGPYVPTTVAVSGIEDQRGVVGPSATVNLQSTLQDPGAVVTGQILNPNGTPSSTALVTYVSNPTLPDCTNPALPVGVAAVPVSSNGYYQFRYVWQSQCGYPFQISTNDPQNGALQQISAYVRATGQQIVLNLALLGVGSVTGQVLNLSGTPVPDVQVVAISGTNPKVGGQAFTDGNGNYTITGIPVGPVTVTAVQGISLGTSAGNIELAGTQAVVNITMNGGSVQVSGTVTLLQGTMSMPVPGVQVVYAVNGGAAGVTTTANDGSYSMQNLPTGPYTVVASINTNLQGFQQGVATAGANLTIPLQIVVPTTGTVTGIVTLPNGTPYGGAVVYENNVTAGVLSAADGSYSLTGLPIIPNQLQTISAFTTDGLRSGQINVAVTSATPVPGANITLSGLGTARFTVLGTSGQPVVGLSVYLVAGGGCAGTPQTTDANGIVTFTGLPVGHVQAAAIQSSGGFNDLAAATVFITQDGTTASGTMQFHGVGTVTGTVVDPNGNPVLGAVVQLNANSVNFTSCTMSNTAVQSVQTSASGSFSFSSVNVGPVSVTATQAFYPAPAGAQGVLATNGGTVNLPLQFVSTISGVLSGTVYLPDGITAAPGVQVTASGPYPNTTNITVTTNAIGFYQFAKILPAGTYTITAADPVSGGVSQMTEYLRVAQNTTQNLRLLGVGTINVTVVDGGGNPVSNAFATLTESGYPNASFSGSLSASNQGVISFPNVFEGGFSVQASDPLGRGGRASGTLPQGVTSLNVQVQLTTTGTVQGYFYLPDGMTPIPNANILLTVNQQVIGQATSLNTGNIGSYSFTYVPAGPVLLSAQDPLSGRTGTATGSITAQGQVLTLNITGQGLDTVQGLVTSNGSPQPGASVSIVSGTFQATTSADSTGMYLMAGVPAGSIVVTASLGGGFLSGTATASITGDGNTFTVPVALQNSGSVTGQVVQAGGTLPAPPSLITISVGGSNQSTTSDTQGNFSFAQVPAGAGTITARELSGIDQGSAPVNVPAAGTTNVVVTFNGTGSIIGLALDSSGNPTAGTIVVNSAGSIFYTYTTTAGTDGTFTLPVVPAGPFTAMLSANIDGFALFGITSGTVQPNGTASITIQVQPSGSISGRIFHSDGVTPDAGAQVSVAGSGQAGTGTVTADASGHYTLVGVPIGVFTLNVTDPATSDRGTATGQITSNGQNLSINISLNGVGSVTVQVDYAAGGVVPNASLTLAGQSVFGGSYTGMTQANGTYTFPNVLAGGFTVIATDPVTSFSGESSGNVTPGGSANVTVQLQPVLTAEGVVYAVDGVTPVAGSTVVLSGFNTSGQFSVQTTSGSNGSFQFTNLSQGSYTLSSYDNSGLLRARTSTFFLSTLGPTVENLLWQGVGTVTGYVYNPGGSPAVAAPVILQALNGPLSGFLQTASDATGAYTIAGVPIGAFKISVSYPTQQLAGSASGSITQDAQQLTININLVSSAVSLPVYLTDGNNYSYDPQPGGSLASGDDGIFAVRGSSDTGAFILDIVSAGSPNLFTGNSEGSQELSGKQIDITQNSLAGLNVTRKVYVPPDGYFVRYLELLSNPGTTPVTVNVQVTSNQYALYWPDSIVASSSGAATLNVTDPQNPDRWVVIDGNETPNGSGEPAVTAFVFDGPGAAAPVDTAQFTTPLYDSAQILYQWSNVTVQPGGSVAFLHFGVQQSSRSSAQASAARLVQLPPEALAGIAPQDLSVIRNFAVPANGTSALAPLPALNGTVSGYLYSGDGTTPIPNQTITLQSGNAYFNRQQTSYTDPTGAFSFTSSLNSAQSSMVLPVDSFTLALTNPPTSLANVSAAGSFPAGQNSATQDLILTGTGTITGTVTYFNGGDVSNGSVGVAESGNPYYSPNTRTSASGVYTLGGIPAGSNVVNASVQTGVSSSISGSAPVTVIAGQPVTANVVLQGTGGIQGTVTTSTGAPIYNAELYLFLGSSYVFDYTDSGGNYSFSNLPVGTYTVTVYTGTNLNPSPAQVAVVAGQNTVQNFMDPASGNLQVSVTYSTGGPAPDAFVRIVGSPSGTFYGAGDTDSSGNLTVNGIPLGGFTVQAYYPGNSQLTSTASGTLVTNGATVPFTIALPPAPGVASVTGQVRYARGVAASGLTVSTYNPNTFSNITATTDANGNYTLSGVPSGGSAAISVYFSNFQLATSTNVTVGAAGTTTTLNITLPVIASVQVTVLSANSTPLSGTTVYIEDSGQPYFAYGAATNSSGVAVIANVPQGAFTVQTNDPYTGQVSGSASGAVGASDDGNTIAVTVTTVFSANVQGTVFAADGQTPIPYATVTAVDPTNNMQLASTSTGPNGTYQLFDVAPSTNSFQIVAQAPGVPSISASANGTFSTLGQTETINLTLPLSILSGTVTYSDGTPVSYPTVFVMQTDSLGNVTTYYSSSTDESGDYTVYGVSQGVFTVFAQDSSSGLSGSASSSIVQLATSVQLTVALQPSGTVSGTVQIWTGGAVPYDGVVVSSSAIQFDRSTSADANGNYSMSYVAVGQVAVSADSPSATYAIGGATSGAIVSSGQTLTLNVPIAQTSTVEGTVFASDGATPVPNAYVAVENSGLGGGLADYRYYQRLSEGYVPYTADSNGNFQVTGVPIGTVQVKASAPDGSTAGWISGTLSTSSTLSLSPVFGNATTFPSGTYLLTDPNGFVYDIACDGSLSQGGQNAPGGLVASYSGAASLLVNQNSPAFCLSRDTGALDQNGQQVTLGPRPGGAANALLAVTRKSYVPASGGYVRYLDSVTNPLSVPVTTTIEVDTNFSAGDTPDTLLADPTTNGSTFAVLQDSTSTAPILGFVFAGTNSSVLPVTSFTIGTTPVSYVWTVTVPPNQTVTLMHFLIQWNSQDANGALAQANSLVNLTDPNASTGMSTQDKQQVVNFNVQ
jgi:hypothetical protein